MHHPIVVCSNSPIKFSATERACETLGLNNLLSRYPASSGVPEQPLGMEETLQGAVRRAFATRLIYPEAILIGIENGLVREADGGFSDFAYVA